MAIRRIRAEAAAKAALSITDYISATIRRAQSRAVTVAARHRFLEHTQRNVQDIESPGSPAIQDPAGDLSSLASQPTSEIAVMPACKTKYKMSPSSIRSEGTEEAAGYCLNSVSYRVDEAVTYNVLNSD